MPSNLEKRICLKNNMRLPSDLQNKKENLDLFYKKNCASEGESVT